MNDFVSMPTTLHNANFGHKFNKKAAREFVEGEYEKLIEIMDIDPQILVFLDLVDNLEIGNNIKKTLKSKLYDFLNFHKKTLGILPLIKSLELLPVHDNLPEDTGLYSIGKINIGEDNSKWKTAHGAIIRIASHSEYLFIRVKNQVIPQQYSVILSNILNSGNLTIRTKSLLTNELKNCIREYGHTGILSQSTGIELIPASTKIISRPKGYKIGTIRLQTLRKETKETHGILLTINEKNPSLAITIASIDQDL